MSFRIVSSIALTALFVSVAACGSDSGSSDDDDTPGSSSGAATSSGGGGASSGGASSGGSTPAALSCEALAMCTTNEVKTFIGSVPAAAGGSLEDGLYRLSWSVYDSDEDTYAGYGSGGVSAILIHNGQYVWAGSFDERGTVATAGTRLTLTSAARCNLGVEGKPEVGEVSYEYTASSDELWLIGEATENGGVKRRTQDVYKRFGLNDGQALCATVDAEPGSPGASMMCQSSNCGCKVALGGTVDAATCP